MLHLFPFYLGIIVLIVLLILLANRLKVAYPVLLVLGGLAVSLVPGIPHVRVNPELIFLIFMPPLLYEAAWAISWKDLWKFRRIVSSFAFVVVFLTAIAVALVANRFIPGFTLALGFLLGGIVSPPDAVSAGAIMKFVRVPPRFQSVIEGESLFNDASSLIIFRFALLAVTTGSFVWQQAATSFVWMVAGGVAIGLVVGYLVYKMHRLLPTNAEMDIVFSLVTPYAMYIAAEAVHASGVLAVVCGGLLLAYNRHRFLTADSRIKGASVWGSFCFILNGLVFILIGLDLPQITAGLHGAQLTRAIGYGVLITAVLVISRLIAAYSAVIVTLIARNFIRVADPNPGWRAPLVLGWSGMRGVVSLAAALSVPVHLPSGAHFPQRNLILFITFVVILLTLVLQGLTLPWIIKKMSLLRAGEELPGEQHYYHLHHRLRAESFRWVNDQHAPVIAGNPALAHAVSKLGSATESEAGVQLNDQCRAVLLALIDKQRLWLLNWNKGHDVEEEHVRMHLYRLDLEEERLKYL